MLITQEKLLSKLNSLTVSERKKLSEQALDTAYRRNLSIDGQLVPFSAIPYLINKDVVAKVISKLEVLTEALILLERYAFSSEGEGVYNRLMNSLSKPSRKFAQQCQFESDSSLENRHRRFDCRLNSETGEVTLLRVNQSAPIGMSYHDTIHQISNSVLTAVGLEMQNSSVAESLLMWFIEEFQQRNPEQFPTSIALVIEHGHGEKLSDLPMIAERIMEICKEEYQYDLQIFTCFPEDLTLWDDAIWFGEESVDMIWRNSGNLDRYEDDRESVEDFLSICKESKDHTVINSTRSFITESAESLALLMDPVILSKIGVSAENTNTLKEVIPETINLRYDGDSVSEIIGEKDDWQSICSDHTLGLVREFGENHTAESWSALVHDRSQREGFVFQKRVSLSEITVWDIDEQGDLHEDSVQFEFCAHHINGKFTSSVLSDVGAPMNNQLGGNGGIHLFPIVVV